MCSNCRDYEGQFNDEEPELELEQEAAHEADMRASGYIARNDPDAMETYIINDQAKEIIVTVCKMAEIEQPNPVAMGHAIELIRGLTSFNAEQMLAKSITAKALDISLLRKQRHEFDQAA